MWFGSIFCLLGCVVLSEPIVGGKDAPAKKYTYQVSLQNESGHFCCGSIISKFWILTVAHCVFETNMTVVTGTIRADRGVRHAIKKIIIHKLFNETSLVNDIAVIKLQKSITFNRDTRPIELTWSGPKTGIYATVAGWGYSDVWYNVKTKEANGISPNDLQMLTVKTISYKKCLQHEPIDPIERDLKLTSGNFCSLGPVGEGPCNGDSGAPIAIHGLQIGLVTFGPDKCAVGKPVVYTKISAFRNWIHKITNV